MKNEIIKLEDKTLLSEEYVRNSFRNKWNT